MRAVLFARPVPGHVLLVEELASLALFDDVVGITRCCGPIEARPKGFSHQSESSCMVPVDARVDLAE
jgi:hypothetical protein